MKNNLIITIIIALAIGVAAFYGGMQYQARQRPSFANRQFMMGTNGQARVGSVRGVRPVNGEIIGQDDKSITVKMQDGSTRIVILSDKTIINKTSESSKADLKTGLKIAAFGIENSDGSITADTVSLNPIFRGIGERL